MEIVKNPVIVCEDDYKVFSELLNLKPNNPSADEMSLAYEIGRAIVVKNEAFPLNTIRIGSHVTVTDTATKRAVDFQLVLPEDADANQKKISILSPMAAAIIGFREGETAQWKMPSGLKSLHIDKVDNK